MLRDPVQEVKGFLNLSRKGELAARSMSNECDGRGKHNIGLNVWSEVRDSSKLHVLINYHLNLNENNAEFMAMHLCV